MNTHSKTLLAILAATVLGCGLLSQRADAAPITGSIDFGGVATFDTTSRDRDEGRPLEFFLRPAKLGRF